jgi:electron-transferring-flavoprotein dehydrogenase
VTPTPTIVPASEQPELPVDRFLLTEEPGEESVPMDVLFVGGGPAGLAGAIQLARLIRDANLDGSGPGEVEIGVLEKSAGLGEHCLSGAVVNPGPFRALFPDIDEDELPFRTAVKRDGVYLLTETGARRFPAPGSMRNHGHYVASICEIVRWLGDKAEELGVNLFTARSRGAWWESERLRRGWTGMGIPAVATCHRRISRRA